LPRIGLRVVGALHGEAEDPDNDDGTAANRGRQELFKRYAIAWLRCRLLGDAAMAPWLDGASSDVDRVAGRIAFMPGSPRPVAPCLA
jgi:hypothetical protein